MKRDECSYAFEQYSEQIRSVGMSVRNTFASAEEVCVCVCVCVCVFTSCHSTAAITNTLLTPCHSILQRSAVHRAVVIESLFKSSNFYGDLPVRPICRILISFYGAILKEVCLGHVRQTYTISS